MKGDQKTIYDNRLTYFMSTGYHKDAQNLNAHTKR